MVYKLDGGERGGQAWRLFIWTLIGYRWCPD